MGKDSAKLPRKVVEVHLVLEFVSIENLSSMVETLLHRQSRPLLEDYNFLDGGMGNCFLLCNGRGRSGGMSFETFNLQPSAVGVSPGLPQREEKGKSLPSCNFLVHNERKVFEDDYRECSARDQAGYSG